MMLVVSGPGAGAPVARVWPAGVFLGAANWVQRPGREGIFKQPTIEEPSLLIADARARNLGVDRSRSQITGSESIPRSEYRTTGLPTSGSPGAVFRGPHEGGSVVRDIQRVSARPNFLDAREDSSRRPGAISTGIGESVVDPSPVSLRARGPASLRNFHDHQLGFAQRRPLSARPSQTPVHLPNRAWKPAYPCSPTPLTTPPSPFPRCWVTYKEVHPASRSSVPRITRATRISAPSRQPPRGEGFSLIRLDGRSETPKAPCLGWWRCTTLAHPAPPTQPPVVPSLPRASALRFAPRVTISAPTPQTKEKRHETGKHDRDTQDPPRARKPVKIKRGKMG
ncbi:hypothetical protein VUR80DRAFT_9196 [Thermomyces stellatus]